MVDNGPVTGAARAKQGLACRLLSGWSALQAGPELASLQGLGASYKRVSIKPSGRLIDLFFSSFLFNFLSHNVVAMEPPHKRQKTAIDGIQPEGDEDELFLEPDELNQQRDPTFQLVRGRALAAKRLKSRFEDIFAKFGRDFTGIADEVDLVSGKVLVDNGHLESITVKDDRDQDNDDDNGPASDEKERTPQGNADAAGAPLMIAPSDPWQVAGPGWPMVLPEQQPFASPFASTPPFGISTPRNLDPAWEAPELPMPSLADYSSHPPAQKRWSTPRQVGSKHLPAAGSPEAEEEEEEDALLGVSGNVCKTNESLLIKGRFPAISSPQDDPNLTEFIQEAIQEAIPESSPSSRKSKAPQTTEPPPKPEEDHLADTGSDLKRKPALGRPKRAKTKTLAGQAGESSLATLSAKGRKGLGKNGTPKENAKTSPSEATRPFQPSPLNQVLYVEIRAAKIDNNFVPVRDEADAPRAADEKKAQVPLSKPSTVPAKYERNGVDPSFNFSDDETLLPKRARKRRQTEPITAAAAPAPAPAPAPTNDSSDAKSKPSSGQPLERNVVDPTFAFSDEEKNMLPRRSKRKAARLSEPAPTTQNATAAADPKAALNDASSRHVDAQDQPKPPTTTRPNEENEQIEPPEPHPSPPAADLVLSSAEADHHHIIQDHAQSDPPAHQPEEEQPVTPSPAKEEPQLPPLPQQAPSTPGKPKKTASKKAHQPPKEQQPAAPSPAKEEHQPPPQQAPSTPRRRPKKAASSKKPTQHQQQQPRQPADTSLISLLSDDDDDEDEISFNLSDFTPSGHHRILVHRPFPPGFTNPSFSSHQKPTTTKKQKKRPSSSSSFLASTATTTTPHHKDKTTGSSSVKRKTSHHHLLPRSVVKVSSSSSGSHHHHRRREIRLPSPTGSIVQTPGGTKRRCGEGDFRCERDFCFVCM